MRMEPPSRGGRPAAMPSAARSLLGLGVFAMTRRQMLGIRDRAEGRPVRTRRMGMGAFRFGPRRRTPTTV